MDIQKILDYQKIDEEAIKIEKKLSTSEFKKNLNNMLSIVKESKNRSSLLENEAGEMIKQFNELKKRFDENIDALESMQAKTNKGLSDEEAQVMFDKIASLSNNLNLIEKKLMSLAEKVNATLNDFEATKKRYNIARSRYNDNKTANEQEENESKPVLQKIYGSLKALESGIDQKLLLRYRALRQDRIFPVVVPIIDKSCGGCRMELSFAAQSKLKEKSYIECEHCHRIIFQ